MSDEHQVNLFARYERQLLSTGSSRSNVIPAVIITGFLGSGKTTLVQHILRNRGSLRIAVLINEVGQVDVDSELVNAKQSNAALGLAAADLSGGCVCCSRAEDLTAALRRIRNPPAAAASGPGAASPGGDNSGSPCDYLLVETSGAADAGPLSEALVGCGFRLDCVVAVVDAEAGIEALQHPVAQAQIACADVVVLNKCDLLAPGSGAGAGLGALADMEDLLGEMAPGVRVVRARYGEVPLTAVLDVEPVGQQVDALGTAAAGTSAACEAGGIAGSAGVSVGSSVGGGVGNSEGFMSHESVPSAPSGGGYRLTSGPRTADGLTVGSSRHTKRRVLPSAPQLRSQPQEGGLGGGPTPSGPTTAPSNSHEHHHHHHHHRHHHPLHQHTYNQNSEPTGPGYTSHQHNHDHHARLHTGFHTESVTVLERPCSLAAFAQFVVRHLVTEPTLLRSKGVLWFGERRTHRFTFHLSGRRRVECCQEGPWEGPPSSQLVLIGTSAETMRRLRDRFLEQVVRQPLQEQATAGASVPGAFLAVEHNGNDSTPPPFGGLGGQEGTTAEAGGVEDGVGAAVAAAAMAAVVTANELLELLDASPWGGAGLRRGGSLSGDESKAVAAAGGAGGVIHFSTRGSALHGINAEDLNAEVMRRGNATGRLLLVGITAPGKISAVTNVQTRDRVLSLLLPVGVASGSQQPEEQASLLIEVAEPILRKAYAHVHNCKCDVASAMQAMK